MKTLSYFLITDCFLLRPVGGGVCIIEWSLSYKWMLHIWIKVSALRMSGHLAKESSHLDRRLYLDCPTKTWTLSVCVCKKRNLESALQLCVFPSSSFNSVWGYIPNRFALLVSESISVLCCGPVGAPRKLELRTRNEMNTAIFMHVWERKL